MLESPLAEHAAGAVMSGPLVEATAHDMAGHAVVERVAEEMLRATAWRTFSPAGSACRRAHSRGS